ncbi:MAG TPA: inner membrane-spanning protein YciB [Povalibacter sp.]|nr:inner membrane-spanning protein YciB [Povalibacter sp.]
MKQLLEFSPLIAFFAAYPLGGIYVATAVLIVVAVAQTTIQWIKYRTVSRMTIASSILAVVFGGLTLVVHDDAFIKWKFSIIYWLLACVLALSTFFGRKPLLEQALGEQMHLDRAVWAKATWAWVVFLLIAGALNVYVIYHFETPFWMKFKAAMIGVSFIFTLVLTFWLVSKLPPEASERAPDSK